MLCNTPICLTFVTCVNMYCWYRSIDLAYPDNNVITEQEKIDYNKNYNKDKSCNDFCIKLLQKIN